MITNISLVGAIENFRRAFNSNIFNTKRQIYRAGERFVDNIRRAGEAEHVSIRILVGVERINAVNSLLNNIANERVGRTAECNSFAFANAGDRSNRTFTDNNSNQSRRAFSRRNSNCTVGRGINRSVNSNRAVEQRGSAAFSNVNHELRRISNIIGFANRVGAAAACSLNDRCKVNACNLCAVLADTYRSNSVFRRESVGLCNGIGIRRAFCSGFFASLRICGRCASLASGVSQSCKDSALRVVDDSIISCIRINIRQVKRKFCADNEHFRTCAEVVARAGNAVNLVGVVCHQVISGHSVSGFAAFGILELEHIVRVERANRNGVGAFTTNNSSRNSVASISNDSFAAAGSNSISAVKSNRAIEQRRSAVFSNVNRKFGNSVVLGGSNRVGAAAVFAGVDNRCKVDTAYACASRSNTYRRNSICRVTGNAGECVGINSFRFSVTSRKFERCILNRGRTGIVNNCVLRAGKCRNAEVAFNRSNDFAEGFRAIEVVNEAVFAYVVQVVVAVLQEVLAGHCVGIAANRERFSLIQIANGLKYAFNNRCDNAICAFCRSTVICESLATFRNHSVVCVIHSCCSQSFVVDQNNAVCQRRSRRICRNFQICRAFNYIRRAVDNVSAACTCNSNIEIKVSGNIRVTNCKIDCLEVGSYIREGVFSRSFFRSRRVRQISIFRRDIGIDNHEAGNNIRNCRRHSNSCILISCNNSNERGGIAERVGAGNIFVQEAIAFLETKTSHGIGSRFSVANLNSEHVSRNSRFAFAARRIESVDCYSFCSFAGSDIDNNAIARSCSDSLANKRGGSAFAFTFSDNIAGSINSRNAVERKFNAAVLQS